MATVAPAARRWPAPLVALGLGALALAVLLAITPLWELPDTFCQYVVDPPSGAGCQDVQARRQHWIAWVLVAAFVVFLTARMIARRTVPPAGRPPRVARWLLVVAVALALGAATFLTYGRGHEFCGSTLSRVDPDGVYSPGKPAACEPSYAASRSDARVLGISALVVFSGATVLRGAEPTAGHASAFALAFISCLNARTFFSDASSTTSATERKPFVP